MSDTDEIGKSEKVHLIDAEIKKGESDEKPMKSPAKNNNSAVYNKQYISKDTKIMNNRRDKYCSEKLYAREAAQAPKTIKVPVYLKPGPSPKRNYIPRNCMTKEEWMTHISTPTQKTTQHCKVIEEKTLKAVPTRINELALPPRQRMVATLKDRGAILPTPLVDRLITVLEAESSLTPEQAEKLFRTKKKVRKRRKRKNRLQKQSVRADTEIIVDEDAKNCQYAMAEAFLKSILEWECTIPKREFEDIAQVIFNRLRKLFHLASVDKDSRRIQQMLLLADIIAAWVAGVLCEVAQLNEDEMKKDFDKLEKTPEEDSDDYDDVDGYDIIYDTKIFNNNNSTNSNDDDDEDTDDDDDYDEDSDDDDDNEGDKDGDDDDGDDDNNVHSPDSDRSGNDVHNDDNAEHNNENTTSEDKDEEKYNEKSSEEVASQMPAENTAESGSEILMKIHSDAISQTVLDDIVGLKTSSIIGANRFYRWFKKMGSGYHIKKPFHSNSINQKLKHHSLFYDSDLSKTDEKNASYSIVEREINPNS